MIELNFSEKENGLNVESQKTFRIIDLAIDHQFAELECYIARGGVDDKILQSYREQINVLFQVKYILKSKDKF